SSALFPTRRSSDLLAHVRPGGRGKLTLVRGHPLDGRPDRRVHRGLHLGAGVSPTTVRSLLGGVDGLTTIRQRAFDLIHCCLERLSIRSRDDDLGLVTLGEGPVLGCLVQGHDVGDTKSPCSLRAEDCFAGGEECLYAVIVRAVARDNPTIGELPK